MNTKYLIAFLCAVLNFTALFSAYGQNSTTLSGKVVDSGGFPLSGVAVIAGPGRGVISAEDGSFTIDIAGSDAVEFSCLGYETVRKRTEGLASPLTIILADSSTMLEEMIVVGYGVQKKVNLTGAISTVSSKDLKNRTAGTLTHMLQGAVPGLSVTTSSGNPADEAKINIRGVTSIHPGEPLVLVDGVEGDLAKVNPQDVESISVIKDASSAAIYGARASFGVILVTTKSGSNTDGAPVVRYSGHLGFSVPTTRTDYIDTGYWSVYICDLFNRGTNNDNLTFYTEHDMEELLARVNDKTENPERPWVVQEMRNGKNSYVYYANTDWYHVLYTDFNPMQQHNVSISGGTDKARYFFSVGYENKQGMFQVRPEQYNKVNLRSKTDFKINDWLEFSNNASFYTSTYDYPGNWIIDYTFSYGATHALASFPPKNPDGTWVYKTSLLGSNVTNGCHIELGDDTKVNQKKKYNVANTAELTAHILDGFDIKANFTYSLNYRSALFRWTNACYSKYPGEILWDKQGRFENKLDTESAIGRYTAANIYANYAHTFADSHNLSAVAGVNYESDYFKNESISGKNLSSMYLSDWKLVQVDQNTGQKVWSVDGGQGEYAIAGAFGRVNYNYKEKYLLELSGRLDGTSKFDAKHRWGFFPSLSAGWRFSDESFLHTPDWFNMGKLRFSVGSLGNQQVGYYDFIRTMNLSGLGFLLDNDNQFASGASLSAPNSGDMTWETAVHYNLGLDLLFLDNRLSFSGEAFIRNTIGMLTAGQKLPALYGAPIPMSNAANLSSRGYELTLGWKDSVMLMGAPLHYSVTGTLSDYVSVITKFQNPMKLMGTYYEGMRFGDIWGFKTDGLFRSDEEAAEYTSRVDQSILAAGLNGGWRGGDVKFVDINGNGEIDKGSFTVDEPGDMCIIGNSNPRYQYGMTLTAEYRGFDFSMFVQGIGHQDWYPPLASHAFWVCFNQGSQSFIPKDFLSKVWSEDNLDAYYPRPRSSLGLTAGSEITTVNDRYLVNIGYCRLKNLTLGYTLPENVVRVLPISALRVYFTGENLAYASPLKKITEYHDPEQCLAGPNAGCGYPWQKSFIFGLDITF